MDVEARFVEHLVEAFARDADGKGLVEPRTLGVEAVQPQHRGHKRDEHQRCHSTRRERAGGRG